MLRYSIVAMHGGSDIYPRGLVAKVQRNNTDSNKLRLTIRRLRYGLPSGYSVTYSSENKQKFVLRIEVWIMSGGRSLAFATKKKKLHIHLLITSPNPPNFSLVTEKKAEFVEESHF